MIPGLGDEKGSVSQNPMIRILQSENEQNHKTIHETKKQK